MRKDKRKKVMKSRHLQYFAHNADEDELALLDTLHRTDIQQDKIPVVDGANDIGISTAESKPQIDAKSTISSEE